MVDKLCGSRGGGLSLVADAALAEDGPRVVRDWHSSALMGLAGIIHDLIWGWSYLSDSPTEFGSQAEQFSAQAGRTQWVIKSFLQAK